MTGARYFAKQREQARLAAIRASTADAVRAAVGKRWTDEGADAPEARTCPDCLGEGGPRTSAAVHHDSDLCPTCHGAGVV